MLKLGLVGGPQVGGSLSPVIHGALLGAAGLQGTYDLLPATAQGLAGVLAHVVRSGYRGVNVTMPHKAAAAAACDGLDGDAVLLGVVNTLTIEAGRLQGDNTDALGLQDALTTWDRWAVPEPPRSAVVLGAGGGAAAAVLALQRLGVATVLVCARRPGAAAALAAARGTDTVAWDAAAIEDHLPGVVINATPAAVDELPIDVERLSPWTRVVELGYGPRGLGLVAAAQGAGLAALDGLEMLLHQAVRAFDRWTGSTTTSVLPARQAARAALGGG